MNVTIQRGATSGVLAGLILGLLFFVDYGPGDSLLKSAGWFGLSHSAGAKWFGFLILIVLGGLFGGLFGGFRRSATRFVSLRNGEDIRLSISTLPWIKVA